MTRRIFPDNRLAYLVGNRNLLTSPFNAVISVYMDSACTIPADCQLIDGTPITLTSPLLMDNQSQLPLWYGPNDQTAVLYVRILNGPVSPVYARANDRLTALELDVVGLHAAIAALGGVVTPPGGGTTVTFSASGVIATANGSALNDALDEVDASGRAVSDAVLTSASPVITSATAAFTSADVGRAILAMNFPTGTTILSVQSGTSCTASANSAAGGGSQHVTIAGVIRTLPATAPAGTVVDIRKVDLSPQPVTIVPAPGDDVEGALSTAIKNPGHVRRFIKGSGTSWYTDVGHTPSSGTGSPRYDRHLNLYLPSDGCLANLRGAIAGARAGTRGPARYLTRGDSTTAGVIGGGGNGSNAPYNPAGLLDQRLISWPDHTRRMLNTSLAMGAPVTESISNGLADARFTPATGWTLSNSIAASVGASPMTFADDNVCNAYDLMVLRQGSATSFTVTIDAGAPQTVTLTGITNNTAGQFRVTATSLATHSVVFSAPASGTIQLLQIEPINTLSLPVLKICRYGISGQQFGTGLIPTVSSVGSAMFPLVAAAPDAIQLHMGINDMLFTLSNVAGAVTTYQTNLAAFVATFQAINCDVILTAWPSANFAGTNSGYYEALPWHQAIYAVADQYGCAVLDLARRWGYGPDPTRYTGTKVPFYDGTHPTLAGYADDGRMVANFLATL